MGAFVCMCVSLGKEGEARNCVNEGLSFWTSDCVGELLGGSVCVCVRFEGGGEVSERVIQFVNELLGGRVIGWVRECLFVCGRGAVIE